MKKKSRTRKVIVRLAMLAAVAALVVYALKPRPVPVEFHTLESGPMRVTLDHEGKTRVREPFVISAPLAGRVHRIELEPGDRVKANSTVLATFEASDPSFIDTRTRAETRAQVKAAEMAIERIDAESRQAETELDLAQTNLRRVEDLAGHGVLSQARLDEARSKEQTLREQLEVIASARRAAIFDLEAAKARLVEPESAGAAEEGKRRIVIRSPIDGVVLERMRQSAGVVPQGEPLLKLGDPANLEVVADFLSTDAVRMKPGMPVRIDRWGGGEELRASIRRIEPSGFMKISALGVEEQRVNVIIGFEDPRQAWESLGSEYRVEAKVVMWEADDVVQVPVSCLFRRGDGWAVFVVKDGLAELREVTVGRRNGTAAEITEGLSVGETVIVYPSSDVKDGVHLVEREV